MTRRGRWRWAALLLVAGGAFGCTQDDREPAGPSGTVDGGAGDTSPPPRDGAPADGAPGDGPASDAAPPAATCPVQPGSMNISVRPFDPADGQYHALAERVVHFEARVVSVEPAGFTLQPDGEAWQIAFSFDPAIAPGLGPGDRVAVDLGRDTPFWEE